MFDNTCKYLAENFSSDFASWLLGKSTTLTKMEPSELSVEPIRADSVIFLQSADIVFHLEFQTETDAKIPYRMANYYLRLLGKYPDKKIYQTVIYLKQTNSPLAFQNSFISDRLIHNFDIVRLWEQPTQIFRQYFGLFPLAVLTKTDDPVETLKEVSKLIDAIPDRKVKSNLAAATAIISGLALDKKIIQRLLRSEIVKESVIYQEILLEGEAKGEAKGKAEGKLEEKKQIALNMLNSNISIDLIAKFTGLSLIQIRELQ